MNNTRQHSVTRREMLRRCASGFGSLALTGLLVDSARAATKTGSESLDPRPPHFPARAKRIIFLFMHGGPSHLDSFDPKPMLDRDNGKLLSSVLSGQSAGPGAKLLSSRWKFHQRGASGLEISDLFPRIARSADDLCLIRSLHTDGQDHGQAVLNLHTGSNRQVRPSLGSWLIYGLGTENQNLPGFITISPPTLNGGPQNYGSAFLPTVFQGTPIGTEGASLDDAQIRNIRNPFLTREDQRKQLDLLQSMNREHLQTARQDRQLEGLIESYELAFRMQSAAPKATDLRSESNATLQLYGIDEPTTDSFGRQCLLARRFAQQGVRFIQVNHPFKWDQHQNLTRDHERNATEVDKPIAGLLADLKSLGMLEDTLVIWGGEFGRTPTAQGGADGRDHNPNGFTIWMAGGGVRGGFAHGATDDYGFRAAVDKVPMHDLHATLLHLLGIDHKRLTFRYAGRDFRLTDVHGEVVRAVLQS